MRLPNWTPYVAVGLIAALFVGDLILIRSGYQQYRDEAEQLPDDMVCGISARSLAAGLIPANFLGGTDDRTLIDGAAYPWSAIGVVYTPASQCSGVLVGDDLVLTAGHCFPGLAEGAIDAGDVWFLAGVTPQDARYESRVAEIQISAAFDPARAGRPETDWAFIRLRDPVGEWVGTIPIADPVSAEVALRGAELTQAGYSTDRPFELTGHAGCDAGIVDRRGWFTHSCDVLPGDSGSPILAEFDGGPQVVGIVTDIYCLGDRGANGGAAASVGAFGAAFERLR